MEAASFLNYVHSLLRYLLLFGMLGSLFFAWRGYLFQRPILNGERMVTIVTVALAHLQLAVGLALYGIRYEAIGAMAGVSQRFWKYEHIGTMFIAIVLVTVGRALAKRAQDERRKQLLIGLFFLAGLLLMLWAIPWPFTALGHGREWL